MNGMFFNFLFLPAGLCPKINPHNAANSCIFAATFKMLLEFDQS